jgi:hypothetical protein
MSEIAVTLEGRAARINAHLRSSEEHGQKALSEASEAGEELIAAKEEVGHGEWGSWLETNCDLTRRNATRYMDFSRTYPGLSAPIKEQLSGLGLRKAADLIPELTRPAPPPRPVETPTESLQNGRNGQFEKVIPPR